MQALVSRPSYRLRDQERSFEEGIAAAENCERNPPGGSVRTARVVGKTAEHATDREPPEIERVATDGDDKRESDTAGHAGLPHIEGLSPEHELTGSKPDAGNARESDEPEDVKRTREGCFTHGRLTDLRLTGAARDAEW